MKKVSVIFGTRPEAIKLAPVIIELKKHPEFDINVCVTAQHRHMLDQVLEIFDIIPDHDLNIMKPNQSLAELTGNAVKAVDNYLNDEKPDIVLVQGDTTTVLAASLASFYNKIPVGHVEAGLRTFNKYAPFPEEINRVLTTRLSTIHFAPTEISRQNLLDEGVLDEQVYVTGNTVIDALFHVKEIVKNNPPVISGIPEKLLQSGSRVILITGHRRENFGSGFESMCKAISILASRYRDHNFIYPVHLNPQVREPVFRILGGMTNVFLIEPVDYLQFVYLMKRSHVILTDSGGIQEEAPSLGKPVLVMRDTTERPEGVDAGTVRLVGNQIDNIVKAISELLNSPDAYTAMSTRTNPYGDGTSSKKIVALLRDYFNQNQHGYLQEHSA